MTGPVSRGRGARHSTMVKAKWFAAVDDRVHGAYCEDCDWTVEALDYYCAIDQGLAHQRQHEAKP